MKRALLGLLLLVPLVASLGCSMCCAPDDYTYPAFGGKWQRVNPEHGRVASPYSLEAWGQGEIIMPQPGDSKIENVYYE